MSQEEKLRIIHAKMEAASEKARDEIRNTVRGPDGKPIVLSSADFNLKLPEPPCAIGSQKNDNIVLNRLPRDGFYRKNSKGDPTPDAKAIANQIFEKYHVVAFKGCLFVYDRYKGVFREDCGDVEHEIETILDYISWRGPTISTRREVRAHLLAKRVFADYPFDSQPDLIPFRNHCAKFSGGDWITEDYQREQMFRYRIPVDLDLEIDSKAVDDLFSQWVEPEDVPVLYQAPAQALVQAMLRQPFKRAYLFMGPSNSGKSSYFELLKRAFGLDNFSSTALQQLNTRFAFAPLEGKLMNIHDDLENVEFQGAGTFKTLTGSCTHQIERKNQTPYVGRITAVHLYNCNDPPKVSRATLDDAAFWGRWEYVIFPNWFPTDPTFYDRVFTDKFIQAFLVGVLRCTRTILRTNRLQRSSAPEAVKDMWICATDPIYKWIKDAFQRELGAFLPTEDIYQNYLSWCTLNKVTPGTKDWLTKSLTKFGFAKRRIKSIHGYAGFRFAGTDPQRPTAAETPSWFGQEDT